MENRCQEGCIVCNSGDPDAIRRREDEIWNVRQLAIGLVLGRFRKVEDKNGGKLVFCELPRNTNAEHEQATGKRGQLSDIRA